MRELLVLAAGQEHVAAADADQHRDHALARIFRDLAGVAGEGELSARVARGLL